MATEQEELQAEVKELRLAVVGLIEVMDEKVQTRVETEVAAKTVPREEYRLRARASGKRAIGGLIAILVVTVALVVWNRVTLQQADERSQARFAATCVDRRAAAALRRQWQRVADIIDGTQLTKPGQPGYIPPKQASKLFAQSYRDAIREAGPAPDCPQ